MVTVAEDGRGEAKCDVTVMSVASCITDVFRVESLKVVGIVTKPVISRFIYVGLDFRNACFNLGYRLTSKDRCHGNVTNYL